MTFEKLFKVLSYSVVVTGVLTLVATGGIGLTATAIFLAVAVGAWRLEGGRRQLSERVGTVLVAVAIPLGYLAWKAGLLGAPTQGIALAGLLGQLIVGLSMIKLLQRKSDRDWVFLYLMAFFEVLLAAGITVSPMYVAALLLFLLTSASAVVVFEMRRTAAVASRNLDRENGRLSRVPSAASVITVVSVVLAVPLFFLLPRGGSAFISSASGIATRTGFSDSVSLGEIGRIQQSDEVVMRVKLDGPVDSVPGGLRWRGVALDLFDNRTWRSSRPFTDPPYVKVSGDYFLVNFASGRGPLITQTYYLEPLDTPVLFALGRPIAVSGGFETLLKNSDDGLKFPRRAFERISYKVGSDPYLPDEAVLDADRSANPMTAARYLQLPPDLDPRIAAAAAEVVDTDGATGRFGKARAIERHLRENFGYTLQMKAGGSQPVADFLFNVREGHCEYFASAMVLMLRTQGIASRVVNGFQQGEYNETADVFVVRQRDAHSWVEVYFPAENAWVPFDPTPAAGRNGGGAPGLLGGLNRYVEALETFWIQYFVAYDNEGQRSLLRSVKSGVTGYNESLGEASESLKRRFESWFSELWEAESPVAALRAAGKLLLAASPALVLILLMWLLTGLRGPGLVRWLRRRFWRDSGARTVEFYERMVRILSKRGLRRNDSQTPLEFAHALGMPAAVLLTERYNMVRFGQARLGPEESRNIERWLEELERGPDPREG
jgi:transglutaminase-like putative cysteine protease